MKHFRYLLKTILWLALGYASYTAYHAYVLSSSNVSTVSSDSNTAWLSKPRVIYNATLKDTQNRSFTIEQLKGQWNLLFFGFTRCRLICPQAMQDIRTVYQNLRAQSIKPLPQVWFVSVDPQVDTPQKIKRFVKGFDSSFRGAVGTDEQLKPLAKSLGVVYMNALDDQGERIIDHSSAFLLLNPEGQLAAVFTSPHDLKAIEQALKQTITQTKL